MLTHEKKEQIDRRRNKKQRDEWRGRKHTSKNVRAQGSFSFDSFTLYLEAKQFK